MNRQLISCLLPIQTAALKALVGKSLKKLGPYKPTTRVQTAVNSIMYKGAEKYLVVCMENGWSYRPIQFPHTLFSGLSFLITDCMIFAFKYRSREFLG